MSAKRMARTAEATRRQSDPMSRAKPFSEQFCPKRSTGNRSRHSRLRCALRLLLVNLFRTGLTRSG